jgi:hypothetical protein
MQLFEVFLAPGKTKDQVLSAETIAETGAQVFTPEEAAFVGLEGLPDDDSGNARVFVACSPGEAKFVRSRLEASADVATFRAHELA